MQHKRSRKEMSERAVEVPQGSPLLGESDYAEFDDRLKLYSSRRQQQTDYVNTSTSEPHSPSMPNGTLDGDAEESGPDNPDIPGDVPNVTIPVDTFPDNADGNETLTLGDAEDSLPDNPSTPDDVPNDTVPDAEETFPDIAYRNDIPVYELETTFNGSNGNNGAMFDVSTNEGDHEIEIIALDIHTNLIQEDCPVLVYGRPGTHVGFENATEAWVLLVNATVECLGFSERTSIPSSLFQETPTIRGGESYAFYTQMPTPNIRYINGVKVGAIYSSNEFLNIHEGTGVNDFFGGEDQNFVRPRVWNGVVQYQVLSDSLPDRNNFSESCNTHLTTTYDDNLGSYGNMFDVVTRNTSIEVYGLDFYTDLMTPVIYEIFTREGTYGDGQDVSRRRTQGITTDPNELSERHDKKSNIANTTNVENMRGLNWALVKRGTTIGRGTGQGTPVRNFVPFTIPPNSKQGFYITLTTPDIRYQDISAGNPADNPVVRLGDTYFENEDIEIQIGVSVGTYPGSSVYYGPRVWSGSIIYKASRDCPSEAPSAVPSTVPSGEPSQQLSVAPSLGLPELGNCTDISSLETTMEGGTGSYGNMFTVTSSEPMSITAMTINAATIGDIYVEVYTKNGDYRGFEEDRSNWRIVAAVNMTGAGSGLPTFIPDEDFEDVHMGVDDMRAFYVTLSTADMKYTRTSTSVGEALTSDGLLTINAGAGNAAPDFGGSLFEPRVFNGAVHYRHEDDCTEDITTTLFYTFNIQHDSSMADSEIIEMVNKNVLQTVTSLMEIDATLRSFTDEHDLKLTNTMTYQSDLSDCTTTSPDRKCAPLETQVTFTHKDSLERGKILLKFLLYKDTIEINLNLDGFQADYDGDIPVQTEVVVSLNGTFTETLSDSEVKYFEAITLAYLVEKLSEIGIDVLSVNAGSEALKDTGRFLQRNDDDGISSSSSIDVSTVVDGAYRPPPDIDFSAVVEDALDAAGGTQFRDDLTSGRRDVPQEIVEKVGTFQTVTSVNTKAKPRATAVPSTTPTIAPAAEGNYNVVILAVVTVVLVLAFLLTVWCYCRKRRKKGGDHGDLVNMGGPLAGTKRGMFSRKPSKGLFDADAVEADCVFAESPYLQEQFTTLPFHSENGESGAGDTLSSSSGYRDEEGYRQQPNFNSSSSSGFHDERGPRQSPNFNSSSSSGFHDERGHRPPPTFNPNMPQYGSAKSLPAGMVSKRYEGSGRSLQSAPSPGRDMGMATMPNRHIQGREISPTRSMSGMGSGGRRSPGAATMMHDRSINSVGNAGRFNGERSMTSMGSGGRRSASPRDQFDDEDRPFLKHPPGNSQNGGFASVSRRSGIGDNEGSVSSEAGGFHPNAGYQHRDDQGPNLHGSAAGGWHE